VKVALLISNYDDEYHGHPEENIHNYINQFEKLGIGVFIKSLTDPCHRIKFLDQWQHIIWNLKQWLAREVFNISRKMCHIIAAGMMIYAKERNSNLPVMTNESIESYLAHIKRRTLKICKF